ncbi:ABC transporter permease [Rummeliibacillus sp. TYF-LIM-RU47]|uniref:ABC transporter permease n=1 Tax=Rummeliibacillus sp. TYF-LIM-RU47 TaxID=2608406 RepID=UPI001238EB4C|nr:ABC transporter permease [Rummeliibacillus sp. TYF-LIM-RU47]
MSKFWILVTQLYKQKIKTKSFILSILLYVAVISCVMFWSDIKAALFSEEPVKIAMVNETEQDFKPLFKSDKDMKFNFTDQSRAEVEKKVKNGKYDAAVFLTSKNKQMEAEIATFEPLEYNDQTALSGMIQYAGRIYAVQQLNLTSDQAAQILDANTTIISKNLDKQKGTGKSEDEKSAGIGVSILIGSIVYSFVISFLSMITTDVASEKGSRVLEVMLASIKPSTHFLAKITGTYLLALTQLIVLIVVQVALFLVVDGGSKWDKVTNTIDHLSSTYILYTIAYLLLSIFLFLIVGALFGSLVSKVEEASQAMMPAMLMGMAGFYILMSGLFSPDTMLVKVSSYIPFMTVMVMPLRISATDLSPMEPLIALIILIVTVIVLFYISFSFYKRSVLTYSSGGMMQKIKTVLKVTT